MNIKYLINRFKQMKHDYIGQTGWTKTCWYIVDYLLTLFIYGASISDYFAYGFYKLRPAGRNEYITYRRYHRIMQVANKKEDIHLCRNKLDFNNHFSDFLGREWIDTKTATREELLKFVQKHPIFFAKDVLGFRGDGVKRIDSTKIQIDEFLNKLVDQKDTHYILDEPLSEIKTLQELHPWSINTLRIVTFYDSTLDKVHYMNARIRIGNKKNNVDNFHYDGIGANIDIPTGIITSLGYDTHNRTYITHPITGKQILGLQIPMWQECIQYIEKAVRHIPTVRYIGWDLVIQEDGKLCLIEANDNADHDFQQLPNKALWKEYKKLLNGIK
jgi:hypothetical protein